MFPGPFLLDAARGFTSAAHLQHQVLWGEPQQDPAGIVDVMGPDRDVLADHTDVAHPALEGGVEPIRTRPGGFSHKIHRFGGGRGSIRAGDLQQGPLMVRRPLSLDGTRPEFFHHLQDEGPCASESRFGLAKGALGEGAFPACAYRASAG